MFILFVCVEGVSLTCVTINRLDYDYGVCVWMDRHNFQTYRVLSPRSFFMCVEVVYMYMP